MRLEWGPPSCRYGSCKGCAFTKVRVLGREALPPGGEAAACPDRGYVRRFWSRERVRLETLDRIWSFQAYSDFRRTAISGVQRFQAYLIALYMTSGSPKSRSQLRRPVLLEASL
jgi:hypothetical protein